MVASRYIVSLMRETTGIMVRLFLPGTLGELQQIRQSMMNLVSVRSSILMRWEMRTAEAENLLTIRLQAVQDLVRMKLSPPPGIKWCISKFGQLLLARNAMVFGLVLVWTTISITN